MEGELFRILYDLIQQEARLRPRAKHVCYSDAHILLVLFWAVLHDRPICWACQPINWPGEPPWLNLPSQATMSRRLKTFSCWMLLGGLFQRLAGLSSSTSQLRLCRRMDCKPLVVGGFSKDRDARRGYATRGIARGYKLGVIWGVGLMPDVLTVCPLNLADPQCGTELLDRLDRQATGYLLADATFDTNAMHHHAADHAFQLLAPRKRPGTSLGHCRQDPARLRCIQLLEGPGLFGRSLYTLRAEVEREFGHLCSFGGGLQPLPSWVRRPRRVTRWVVAKLIINAIHRYSRQQLAA